MGKDEKYIELKQLQDKVTELTLQKQAIDQQIAEIKGRMTTIQNNQGIVTY
jgi:chaperonin cofactor prefoldin